MIELNYRDARPIYEQIKDGLRKLMLSSVIRQDEKLPSVRELASQLAINPNTIQKAYAELERQGFIYVIKGRGNFVSGDSGLVERRKRECIEQILALVREVLEIGMSKTELIREIEVL